MTPHLDGALRAEFDTWLEGAVARFVPPLRFREVRSGVQALSSLYVERRAGADLAGRARKGLGKRAALATYYAPLHFLAVHHALEGLGPGRLGPVRRVYDLGCGTGACGAAVARSLDPRPSVVAVDRSGFALAEARLTLAKFGVPFRTRRAALPRGVPRAGAGDLLVLGWVANELADRDRDGLLHALRRAVRSRAVLLVFEPLAGAASPWWGEWLEELSPLGVEARLVKVRVALPEWVARLDLAAGLDHGELGARLLAGPLAR